MKNSVFTHLIVLLSFLLFSSALTAAMLRLELQPATFYNNTGGSISGWIQIDTLAPWGARYDIRTTAADKVAIEGYRYYDSSIDPRSYSSLYEFDATHLGLNGFNISYQISLFFSASIFDSTKSQISYEAIETNEFYGDRLAGGQAIVTRTPLTNSGIFFLTGMLILSILSLKRYKNANHPSPTHSNYISENSC
jgi:hypothetical protein